MYAIRSYYASLEGEDLEGYSIRVAQSWGIGQKGQDNGALLLIAKARITSYNVCYTKLLRDPSPAAKC